MKALLHDKAFTDILVDSEARGLPSVFLMQDEDEIWLSPETVPVLIKALEAIAKKPPEKV